MRYDVVIQAIIGHKPLDGTTHLAAGPLDLKEDADAVVVSLAGHGIIARITEEGTGDKPVFDRALRVLQDFVKNDHIRSVLMRRVTKHLPICEHTSMTEHLRSDVLRNIVLALCAPFTDDEMKGV